MSLKPFPISRAGRVLLAVVCLVAPRVAFAADAPDTAAALRLPERYRTVVFGCYAENLAAFEAFARRAREAGATHIVLTAEDLPWAMWQMDTPGDPYPAWAVSNVGLLKIAVPVALRPYVPADYAERVMQILADRCGVLRKLGLKATFTTFEPQMLPEAVYRDHPRWRGPQVDHPFRSRVPRFAPDVDHAEVLALYRESMRLLVQRCPEIEIVTLHTNDSGAGLSWSDGLYPGPNGASDTEGRPMHRRYRDFLGALQAGAREGGVAGLQISVAQLHEAAADLIARQLPAGAAVANLEGPEATPFADTAGFLLDYRYPFYPARGIPLAMLFLEELEQAGRGTAPRLFVLLGDRFNQDLYFRLHRAFFAQPTSGQLSRIRLLEKVAADMVGADNAASLAELWLTLHELQKDIRLTNRGGFIFYLGSVQQRWLTRPFVPFPGELTLEEQSHYRPFIFQALSEARALALDEMQGTHWLGRGGGKQLPLNSLFARMAAQARGAAAAAVRLQSRVSGERQAEFAALDARLRVFECLVNNALNALNFQYYLDLCEDWDLRRPHEELQSLNSIPEWLALRNVARREIDNATTLIELLESGQRDLIDLAPTAGEESIRVLGPGLADQLQKKTRIMFDHWEDFERLFIKEKD